MTTLLSLGWNTMVIFDTLFDHNMVYRISFFIVMTTL
jgi:hypothetical protein